MASDSTEKHALAVEEFGGVVVRMDASRMRTEPDVFGEYKRGFRFPEYFGHNWSAMNDCLRDLSWLPARAYLTIISNPILLLDGDLEARDFMMSKLEQCGKRWSESFALGPQWGGGEVPFHTVLVESRERQPSEGER